MAGGRRRGVTLGGVAAPARRAYLLAMSETSMEGDAAGRAVSSKPALIRKIIRHAPFIGASPAVVPVLALHGEISAGGRLRRSLSLADYARPIEQAFKTSGAKAVALTINSPGGSPVQARLICDRIRAHAEEKKLPVYAFAEDVAASGGYMLALAADEIYADASSILGSIGVISAGFGFQNFIARYGVERRVYAEGDNKGALDPFLPERKEDVDMLRDIQKDVHESFKQLVKARRGDRLGDDEKLIFSGAFWSATRAKALGLIDGIAEPRGFFRAKFGEDVKLKRIPTDGRSLVARLFSGRARAAEIAEDVLDLARARALWSRYGL
ncbi:MAG: S49 family peptidase [Parvularculaceae bacterium]